MRATLLLQSFVIAALLSLSLPAHADRLALVIGNRDYTVGPLKNPINDAIAIGAALRTLGFQVTAVNNLKRDDIGRTVEGFVSRIRAGDDIVVFYAGHGVQVKGVNYLPAVDANIRVESDVALNSLNLNHLLDRLDEAKSGVRLLLIDACRDNPYSRGFRSGSRGLARVEGAPSGTLMHFATRPGGVAADGTGGNGLYTTELLKHLKAPGLPVESMLKRVAAGVRQASGGDQQPWTEGALDGEFYFAQGGSGQASAAPTVQIASVRPEPVLQTQATRPTQPVAGQVFKDCADCPEMVVIPSGNFRMGEGGDPLAIPVHSVSVSSFAIGKYEVTRGQFAAFVAASGFNAGTSCWVVNVSGHKNTVDRSWRTPGYSQTESDPVACVNWEDAQAYVRWLNQKTGQSYRLPSEAEWEYACRAGANQTYCGSENVDRVAVNDRKSGDKTQPVGSKQPNAWGLYDMSGNVSEWTQDCWNDHYNGAPNDGSAWTIGVCSARVVRGASWMNGDWAVRAVTRDRNDASNRIGSYGFRLARSAR